MKSTESLLFIPNIFIFVLYFLPTSSIPSSMIVVKEFSGYFDLRDKLWFNFRLIKIKEWVDSHDPGSIIIPFSGLFESKISEMPDDERQAYLNEHKTTRY